MKEKIGYWFRHGLWTEAMVKQAMDNKVITKEEYKEIIASKAV